MTEQPEQPETHGSDTSGSAPPPPPPPPPPGGASTVSIDSETEVRSGGIGGRIVAGALGLVLLVGGVAFAATQLGSSDDRAPEDAVAEMFDAIANEDLLGVLATLDPGERDALSGPIEDMFDELQRLEVLDDSFELNGVTGIDLEFQDLTFRPEPVREDLVRVYLTGGTASFDLNSDELPIGAFLVDTFDRFGVEYRGIQESDSDAIEDDDTFLVVRDAGDGWRVSIGYTAAEAARNEAGKPMPAIGSGLAPIGADSPEAALDGMLRSAAELDVRGMVARLSPGELGALQDYWPIFVDDATLPSASDLGVDIEIRDLDLRSDVDGNRATVFVDGFDVTVTAEDMTVDVALADGCLVLGGDAEEAFGDELPEGPICAEDLEELASGGGDGAGFAEGFGLDTSDLDFDFDPSGFTPELGITAQQVDGGWYVAPLGTSLDTMVAVLEALEREDLDAIVDAVEAFVNSFTEAFSGGFTTGDFDDFDDFEEDFDQFEEFGDVEEFGEFDDGFDDDLGSFGSGLPRPGIDDDPMATDAALVLEELSLAITGDPQLATCLLDQLYANATTDELYELADAYELDFEPSTTTQDVFFTALEVCGA